MKKKFHYSTDILNRLLVKKGQQIYLLEGKFKLERNELVFETGQILLLQNLG
jgi:hypothetical protein